MKVIYLPSNSKVSFKERFNIDLNSNIKHLNIYEDPKDMELFTFKENRALFSNYISNTTFTQFKEDLFLRESILLREEKQVILLFNSLSRETKKKLGVSSYFDIIDIASNFFNFFKVLIDYTLTENQIREILLPWQVEIFDTFLSMKNEYLNLLEERNYTDSTFNKDMNFITTDSVKKYQCINIFNKFSFTPLDKKIFKYLEDSGFTLRLFLEVERESFSFENLSSCEIDPRYYLSSSNKISIYRVSDELSTLYLTIKKGYEYKERKVNFNILDFNNDNFKYNHFFNMERSLIEIDTFKGIFLLHELIATGKPSLSKGDDSIIFDLNTIVGASKSNEFLKLFNFSPILKDGVNLLKRYDYKRISFKEVIKLVEESHSSENFVSLSEVGQLLTLLSKVYNFSSLKEWCEFLSFDRSLLKKEIDSNFISKYFEVLSEISVIEDLDIRPSNSWEDVFEDNISEGLLRIIIKYFRFKTYQVRSSKFKKGSYDKGGSSPFKVYINATSTLLPALNTNDFLLTDGQKRELGIPTYDDLRILEKIKFLKGISRNKETTIITCKNLSKNISISSFVENLLLLDDEFKVESNTFNIDNYREEDIIRSLYEPSTFEKDEKTEYNISINKELISRSINAYMSDELFNCEYKMYLRYILKVYLDREEIDEDLSLREYGSLAHDIFEYVLKDILLNKGTKYFDSYGNILLDEVEELVFEYINTKKNPLKLPSNNRIFYDKIIFKNLAESLKNFFYRVAELKGDSTIINIGSESSMKNPIFEDFYQNARIDFFMELSSGEKIIIDYKTGQLNQRQLDFYSILVSGSASGCSKYIYNIETMKLEMSEKIVLTKEDLIDKLSTLLDSSTYERKITSSCSRCDYVNLCLMEEEEL